MEDDLINCAVELFVAECFEQLDQDDEDLLRDRTLPLRVLEFLSLLLGHSCLFWGLVVLHIPDDINYAY